MSEDKQSTVDALADALRLIEVTAMYVDDVADYELMYDIIEDCRQVANCTLQRLANGEL